MLFKILSLSALAAFYSVYIGKIISQSRRGIHTDQLCKGNKTPMVFFTELTVKILSYILIVAEVCSIFLVSPTPNIFLRCLSLALSISSVAVFSVAVHTMRDSWRAGLPETDTSLVTNGIYSWSRNPAFFAFDLMYLGILLMFFNMPLMIISLATMLAFHLQILQEEKFLTSAFGKEYSQYKSKVRRYIGRK